MRCFIDASGLSRIDVAPFPDTVASFLELDVRDSVDSADELRLQIDAIMSGRLQIWEMTGETFDLTLRRDGVSIDCVWGDNNCRISLADFRECLLAWRAFIGEQVAR